MGKTPHDYYMKREQRIEKRVDQIIDKKLKQMVKEELVGLSFIERIKWYGNNILSSIRRR